MRFRTEIEPLKGSFEITHSDSVLLLGSCFSDNIGARMQADGFDVAVNPLGPLYNPDTLGRLLSYLLDGKHFISDDFVVDDNGIYHCLDFAMRYQNADASALAAQLNDELTRLGDFFDHATVICVTFGSSHAFIRDGAIVGNCHKLPSTQFELVSLSVDEIVGLWGTLLSRLAALGKKVILTVSPIRHLAYGLHGNQLGKARLLLACEELGGLADYFPSYEIMMDDLRDYRFYAADMKHPSEVACDYIYDIFGHTYFSKQTMSEAQTRRKATAASAHRPILDNK